MHWHGYGWLPQAPPHQADHHPHTSLLMDLNRAITSMVHTLGGMEARLEHGDTQFREIKDELGEIKSKVATIEQQQQRPPAKPSLAGSVASLVPAVKEAWPFLAVLIAGGAKALGYDLSWLTTP